ncbi:MAG: primosomal protein N' [Chloroflexia bacterium]|nr:primosomal protein N' [Chloroflexia bacterium]
MFGPRTSRTPPSRVYADVIVRQRNRAVGTFSYTVPPELQQQLKPGLLVWVPFRQGQVPAIVVSMSTKRPPFPTKTLLSIIDPALVLTETQLALGRWMSEYYVCSLGASLFAMLPPGLLHRTRSLVRLSEAGRKRSLEGLSPLSCQVIEVLREAAEEISDRALSQALGRRSVSRVMGRLSRRGWLELRTVIEEPQAQPHYETFLELDGSEQDLAALRQQLWAGRRNSAPARVLEALARSSAGMRELRGLYRELHVGRSTLRTLEEQGLVEVEAELCWLRLAAGEEEVEAFLAEWESRAPAQAALLREVLGAAGRLDLCETDVSSSVRRALRGRGLIEEQRRPARARLLVLVEEALERAAELRRTRGDERQLALLDALTQSEQGLLPLSALYKRVDGADRSDIDALLETGLLRLEECQRWRDPLADQEVAPAVPPPLTGPQGQVWREIYEAFGRGGRHVFLLHGVTGSGKTEIYLRALGRVLREGRRAMVLVPEISLTPQTVQRFEARFPGRVTVLHSGLSLGERYDQWRRIRDGLVDVVIGPRSALLAPLPDLGLIVLDEEHETSYKQDERSPRYHARETALELAGITGSVLILGGATPSLESYTRALEGRFRLLELPDRIRVRQLPGGVPQALVDRSMPRVEVVDMREELRAGNHSMFSRALQAALRQVLRAGEQAILFLNRRGTATFVLCRECGYVARCPRCEVAYVYHADLQRLVCHRCGRQAPPPQRCPECGSRRIRHFGTGTERVVQEVRSQFPQVGVLRWDSDVGRTQQDHEQILGAFVRQEAAVLVGTQLLAKGLDLPQVTLVGVVSADTALQLPDFRAAERTFQLVTQVIGRAGRREERGRAVIQTYHPEHYAIQAAAQQDYAAFYRQEMGYRRRHGYPPLCQLALLLYSHRRENLCREEVSRVAEILRARLRAVPPARLVGPAPAFMHRQRGQYRWQLLLLADEVQPLLRGLDLPEGWVIDVDPLRILT